LANEDDVLDEDEDEEDIDDDADDDLYGDGPSVTQASNGASQPDPSNTKAGDYIFSMHDSLVNIGPITDVTLGSSNVYADEMEKSNFEGVTSELELAAAVGRDKAGAVAIVHRNIEPKVIGKFEFPEARGIWTMSAKRPTEKGLEASKEKSATSGDYGADAQYDRLMIVSKALPDGNEISDVYALTSANFEALTGTEFEPAAGPTIEAGTLGNGMRVIQVLKSEVRSYDGGKSFFSSRLFFLIESNVSHGDGGEFRHPLGIYQYHPVDSLSEELYGNILCPIASMKVFTMTTFMHPHHVPLSGYIILQLASSHVDQS
jgi:cleavage and polyadenylation specificity factor subunit 1